MSRRHKAVRSTCVMCGRAHRAKYCKRKHGFHGKTYVKKVRYKRK